MKRKITLLLAVFMLGITLTQAKTALVVIAHGAPSPEWRKPVLDLEKDLQNKIRKQVPGIDYIRVAMMEFSSPTVQEVIRDCEKQGIDTVFAVPLFIAPSSHSDEDIPNLLGMQYNPKVIASLKEEGSEPVKTKMKIILGAPLSYSSVLKEMMLERVNGMSKNPGDEAVILLAHGDMGRTGIWADMMKENADYIKANTKISDVSWNFIAMGYYFADDVTKLVKKAAENHKRVLVQGVFLVSDMAQMAQMAHMDKVQQKEFKDTEVVWSDKGILPAGHDAIVQWITDQTLNWVKNR